MSAITHANERIDIPRVASVKYDLNFIPGDPDIVFLIGPDKVTHHVHSPVVCPQSELLAFAFQQKSKRKLSLAFPATDNHLFSYIIEFLYSDHDVIRHIEENTMTSADMYQLFVLAHNLEIMYMKFYLIEQFLQRLVDVNHPYRAEGDVRLEVKMLNMMYTECGSLRELLKMRTNVAVWVQDLKNMNGFLLDYVESMVLFTEGIPPFLKQDVLNGIWGPKVLREDLKK